MSVQFLKKITGSKLWQFLFPKFAKKKEIVVKTEFSKESIIKFLKKNTEPVNLLRYTDANMFMSPSKKIFEKLPHLMYFCRNCILQKHKNFS